MINGLTVTDIQEFALQNNDTRTNMRILHTIVIVAQETFDGGSNLMRLENTSAWFRNDGIIPGTRRYEEKRTADSLSAFL